MRIGTCLNVGDHSPVRIVVGSQSVELFCAETQIEMDAASLALFISTGEEALPLLRPTEKTDWVIPYREVETEADRANSTWVICDVSAGVGVMLLGDCLELQWGLLTWTITRGALSGLLERARQAQRRLDERLNAERDYFPELEIPQELGEVVR